MKQPRFLLIILILSVGIILFYLNYTQDTKATQLDEKENSHIHNVNTEFELSSYQDFITHWKQAQSNISQISQVIQQAKLRKIEFTALMATDPDKALAKSLTISEHLALPKKLKPYFEQRFSATGDIDLRWATSISEDGYRSCQNYNTVKLGNDNLIAYTISADALPILNNTPISGIRLGDKAVITTSSVYKLNTKDLPAALAIYPIGYEATVDPVTKNAASEDHAALIGGKIYHFESDQIIDQVSKILSTAREEADEAHQLTINQPFEWLAGNTGGDEISDSVQATPYQEDQIDVLFIRVDFSDFSGEPVTKEALETTLLSVNDQIEAFSYNIAGINYTVTDSHYRMPSTGATYAVNGDDDGIQTDARALAAADYTIANYDVIAVFFPNIGNSNVTNSQINYGGLASVGGSNHWVNGFNNVDLILHEFGHNYGLYHANYYHPEQQLGGTYQVTGSLEYGDIFDVMGNGDSPEGHFNHLAKNYLQWMPDSKVTEATESGTYRIYRFDHETATNNDTLALKVFMEEDVNYWVGFRKLYTSSTYNLSNGAYVVAENLASARETSLIDMTPESQASETDDRRDAGLAVSDSYYDSSAGVTFNALSSGGTTPNEWIDIQIIYEPRVSIADTEIDVDEQSGNAFITVQRTFNSEGEVSVNFTTADITTTADTDYYATSGTLTWADGDTSDKTIIVPIRPDSINEGGEEFSVTLSGIIGGKISTSNNQAIVNILESGQRYSSFNTPYFYFTVRAIATLSNGKVLVGGNFEDGSDVFADDINHIARLNSDGSADTSFIQGTGFDAPVNTIHIQNDGKILVGGEFTSYNGVNCNRLVRLYEDGAIDQSFVNAMGDGANDDVNAIALETNDEILVGGDFTEFDNSSEAGLVRLLSTGARSTSNTLSQPFNSSYGVNVNSIIAQDDTKIVIGGSFYVGSTGSGFRSGIARLNDNGTRDTSFDPDAGAHFSGSTGSLGIVYDVKQQSDGKYVLGGYFTAYDGNDSNYCARVNNDGTFDNSFTSPQFNSSIRKVLPLASGKTLVGGAFTSPVNRLEMLASDGTSDSNFIQGTGPSGTIYSLAFGNNNELWIGGNSFSYDGETAYLITKTASGVTPYDFWSQSYFTAAEILSGNADPDADPDGDGIQNIAEMAFSTSPIAANSSPVFEITSEEGIILVEDSGEQYLQVSMDKNLLGEGAWFVAQFTSDLATWSPVSPTPQTNSTYDVVENSATKFTVRDKTPISSNAIRFGRIGIEAPE
ncbi:MAG: Calx-beta domain-containing protein [Akkermansiaceae bacterium]